MFKEFLLCCTSCYCCRNNVQKLLSCVKVSTDQIWHYELLQQYICIDCQDVKVSWGINVLGLRLCRLKLDSTSEDDATVRSVISVLTGISKTATGKPGMLLGRWVGPVQG